MSKTINSFEKDILEYKQQIKNNNIPRYTTNENWNCAECLKDFKYRPYACAVICNNCLLKMENK